MEKKILVVDDDLGPRELLRMILTSNGYYVSTAEDGSGGLDEIQKAKVPYDLIITGIAMPGMQGDEMISIIRETDKDIPILVVSGGRYERGCELVKEGMVSACFPKPFNSDELLNKVEQLLSSEERMKKRILFVNDDLAPRETVESILLKTGNYIVSTAEDAFEALRKLQEAETPYDLIITDYRMPGMNGDEMALEIRKNNVDTPIILMSSWHDERLLKLVEEGLFSTLIEMPFNVEDLISKVRLLLGDS